ncbi:DUF4175 family protein [uncultured Algimonas sp.]|uniref:DUF4175 domain-containing protein n=1 Tax=uncultured Algimonas sp. TaxID=1547920 RepID=UPI0026393451|nr:DUF4175 family protein [uncultured Algimonas sp.]
MPTSDTVLPIRLRRLAVLARARLVWEAYAPVLALPALALAAFLILTWFGTWEVAGDPLRLLALTGTLALIGRAAFKVRRKRWPTRSDALRRLERTAGLSHRPLDTLRDAPALSPELWPAHLKQAGEQADAIRGVGRKPALSRIDRYGLRIVAPIALGLALFLTLGLALERTRRALSPVWLPPTNPYDITFEAWVDPPDYTGRPPIYAQGDGPIRAPVGSTLVVRASGASVLPRPRYIGEADTRFIDPVPLGRTSAEARTVIDGSGVLDWRIGPRRKVFTVDALPDAPPTIDTLDDPEADKRDRLVLRFDASDDYGVEEVRLEMIEIPDAMDIATVFDGDTSDVDTQAGGFKDATDRSVKLDLTRHPLAGRKVAARLVAVDGAGQRGVSEPFFTTVPDKIFVEPLAKAIIEQRGLVLRGSGDYGPAPEDRPDNDASDGTFDTLQTAWRLGRAPEPVQRAALLIDAVTERPDPAIFNDPVVYLGLRHIGKTLRYAKSAEALNGLPDHMWTLANRAEFGVLGTALQEMQEAQAALREGIARRAPQREIDTLFERYNQAVDAYMEELRKNAEIADPSGGGSSPMGSTDEIQALLDAIEEANRVGDTEGARRALEQLAELLETMQMQITPGGGGGGDGDSEDAISEEMREALEELAESLGEQRDLQDRTRQAERDELMRRFGEPGRAGEPTSPQDLADRQAEIERMVEGLREQLPGAGDRSAEAGSEEGDAGSPEPGQGGTSEGDPNPNGTPESGGARSSGDALGRALEAMGESEEALGRGSFGESRNAQMDAIRALRDAGDALGRELAERREASGESAEGTDPLGRGLDGMDSDNAQADLDPRDNAERSREILEELRRRASEAERDQQERDYLDRLLRRF